MPWLIKSRVPDHHWPLSATLDTRSGVGADRFGFLPKPLTVEFDGGNIAPVPEYSQAKSWVDVHKHEDGFLYPPLERTFAVDAFANEHAGAVPHTERPAVLHRLPASHTLELISGSGSMEERRRGAAGFLLHLFGYLAETWLQFHDWWFTSRVPIHCNGIGPAPSVMHDFVSHCYGVWRTWKHQDQRLITNILYMHCRGQSYQWDWEQFAIEYMVTDGCYRLAQRLHGVKAASHPARVGDLCRKFCIPPNEHIANDIVRLRRDLFHETLWDGAEPCTAVSEAAYRCAGHLRSLNQRLIPALFGYRNTFVRSPWWAGPAGSWTFDKAK